MLSDTVPLVFSLFSSITEEEHRNTFFPDTIGLAWSTSIGESQENLLCFQTLLQAAGMLIAAPEFGCAQERLKNFPTIIEWNGLKLRLNTENLKTGIYMDTRERFIAVRDVYNAAMLTAF